MRISDEIWENKLLPFVAKPAQYVGGELNLPHRDWQSAQVRMCFAFPDLYEIGMSHLGLKILYGLINREDWSLCERFFMPWTDMIEWMKKENIPLLSMESRRPLNKFDVIGFTLQYEMSYSNILAMLDMGKIPLKGKRPLSRSPI